MASMAHLAEIYILQRGVQWKLGVVICMVLYMISTYDTTPIRCTPLPLHPPVINTQESRKERTSSSSSYEPPVSRYPRDVSANHPTNVIVHSQKTQKERVTEGEGVDKK